MGSVTPRLSIPYPVASDSNNIPADMQSLATRLDGIVSPFQVVTSLPAAGNSGFLYLLGNVLYVDTGSVIAPLNAPTTATFQMPATWTITGPFDVTSGADTYLPGLIVPCPTGQTSTLERVVAFVRSGSCTVSMSLAGAAIAGLGAMNLTATPATFTPTDTTTFTDLQDLQLAVTAVSGSPDGLDVTAMINYTITIQD